MKFNLTFQVATSGAISSDATVIVIDASDEAAALAQLQSAKGEGVVVTGIVEVSE